MKKQTKIFTIIAAYFCLLIFDSCSNPDDLGCSGSNQPPFYDFQSFVISPNQNEILTGQKLELTIQLSEFSYLAFYQPNFSFGLVSKAYGCSPLPPGYEGAKFPIEKIEIFSNQNFNSSFPASTSLNELVTLQYYDEEILLEEANMDQLNFQEVEYTAKKLIIEAIPDELNLEHNFTIKLTKSNGEVVENSVSGIAWK